MFDCLFLEDAIMEAWREYSDEELKEHYAKKDSYSKNARKSYILHDFLALKISNALRQSDKERILFKYISQYADRNVEILTSPYFTKNMIFTDSDENIVFSITDIDKKELSNKIKEMPKPPGNSGSVNVTPFRVLMIFMIGYYAKTKEYKKMEYIYRYYAYSQFPTLFYSVGFRKGILKPEAMEYAVDNMEKKFHLKKYGSVDVTMVEAMKKTVMNFLKADKTDKPDFRDLNDFNVLQIAMALKSRQAAWMKKVYAEYKKTLESGEYITTLSEDYDEDSGDIIERETTSGSVKKLADKYTLNFFTTPVMKNLISISAKRCEASQSELLGTLEAIKSSNNNEEVNKFYCAIFQLFFNENSKYTENDVRSAAFGSTADAIFRRSNSNDPLIDIVKTTTNKWLTQSSNVYRGTTRPATKSNYKRAIYLYFVLLVMWR